MQAKITESLISTLKATTKSFAVCDTELAGFRLVVRPTGVMSFIYSYRNQAGIRKSYTIGKYGSVNVYEARKAAKQKASQVGLGTDIQQTKKNEREKTQAERLQTVGVFFDEEYEPFLIANLKTGKSIAQQLRKHFISKWKDKQLSSINHMLVIAWRNEKKAQGYKNGGINRPVTYLKAMLNRAVAWNFIEKYPLLGFKKVKEDDKISARYLTKDEERSLFAAIDRRQDKQKQERISHIKFCNKRRKQAPEVLSGQFTDYLKPLILLALNTGLRKGELFKLKWSDVDIKGENPQITVQGGNAKSGCTRYVPLNQAAHTVLCTWRRQVRSEPIDEFVFKSPKTGSCLNNVQTSWEEVLKDAGIANFRFHDLRHTFASRLVMSNVPIYTVAQLLGHSSVVTTQRYAHLSSDHKASAVAML